MNGIIMLFVYAAIMILATVTMTKKEKNVVNFCVGSRSENWILSALSIAATWNGSSEGNRMLIWLPCIGIARCSAEVPEKGKRRKQDRSRKIIGRS